ncbi:hypothetical protein HYQ46_012957 [Verticillium longisporum]|nr:hypothetical protein HYQ46_012957 [Verticillium longisporum]
MQDKARSQFAGLVGVGAETANVLQAGVLVGNLLGGRVLNLLEVLCDTAFVVDLDTERNGGDHGAFNLFGAPEGSIAPGERLAKDDVRRCAVARGNIGPRATNDSRHCRVGRRSTRQRAGN